MIEELARHRCTGDDGTPLFVVEHRHLFTSQGGAGARQHRGAAWATLLNGEPVDPAAPTVLVCDDDATVVDQFVTLLRGHGYRPIGVTDGARAIELAGSRQPSAVVLDLVMPGTTGAQVVSALRSTPTTANIPIVVISGLGPEADADVARSAEGWLIKPVTEDRLV